MDENDILNVNSSSDSLINIPSYLGATTYAISSTYDHCTGSANCPHDWEDCGQVSPCETTAECSQWTPCSSNAQCSQWTPTKPGNATSLTVVDWGYDWIEISYAAVSNASWYKVFYRKKTESTATEIDNINGTSYTIRGLEMGTTYVLNYCGVNSAGQGSVILPQGPEQATKDMTAYIQVLDPIGSTSITVRLNGLQTAYAYNDRKCQWYLNGVQKAEIGFGAGLSYAAEWTFTGLAPNTTYEIMAIITGDAGGGFTKTLYEYVTTINIPKWVWNDANYSGSGHATATQTINAYIALTNNGYTEEFSYLVWNDMCQKVNDVLYNAGYSWDTTFASYVNTKMTSSGQCLTAAQFNSLKQNIGSHYSTGIANVSSGDLMYGSYFITLMSKVNSWIDTL